MADEPILDEVRSWFNSIAQAQGWKCSFCGEVIQVEDRYVTFDRAGAVCATRLILGMDEPRGEAPAPAVSRDQRASLRR
jgi:hypothetical protein